jgi:glucose/arabinose dehydrogenase
MLSLTLAAPHPAGAQAECDAGNGGIQLPEGFCAWVVADDVGRARHLVVSSRGDIYVALRGGRGGEGGILALRDTDGDGRADVSERFGDERGGTGIALHDGYLYFGRNDAVLRYRLDPGRLVPEAEPEVVVSGLPSEGSHAVKSIALGADGYLYVNVGSPSNSCQREDRTPGSPGEDPCPELETRAGIWRFDVDRLGQEQGDGERWASGLRNTVALAADPASGTVYGAIHGRDQLHQNWGDLYDEHDGAEKPSEEFHRIDRGDDYSWPYCYHDGDLGRLVLAPEYGGDASAAGRCADHREPLLAFPGHWAPNALTFYHGRTFPERFHGGVFIAFHGSWNRAPLPQQGYNLVFVPFISGEPVGSWEVFADGFAGENPGPRSADHRPSGLAVGPDGSLYVADDRGGRIWRIVSY